MITNVFTLFDSGMIGSTHTGENFIHVSPFEFQQLTRRTGMKDATGADFSDATSLMDYNAVIAATEALALKSGVVYDTLTATDSVSTLPILRIFDDGRKPVLILAQGVHGNEMYPSHGLFSWLNDLLDNTITDDPVFNYIRSKFTLVVFPMVNPYGVKNAQRVTTTYNGTLEVDINRNCNYYWAMNTSADKGAYPNQKENGLIHDYLVSKGMYQRLTVYLDRHCWGYYGQNWIGFLNQNHWHSLKARVGQRAGFAYYRLFMEQADDQGDWAGFTLTSDVKYIKPSESFGDRKPYIAFNGIDLAPPVTFRLIVEMPSPFTGTPGAVGENNGVLGIASYHCFHAHAAAAIELFAARTAGIKGELDSPAMTPLNNNSTLEAWNVAAIRPQWTTYSRLVLTQLAEAGKKFTRAYRPQTSWPGSAFAEGGYCQFSATIGTEPHQILLTIGGATLTGYTSQVYTSDLTSGEIKYRGPYPFSGKYMVPVTDGTTIWVIGGFDDGSTYRTEVYSCSVAALLAASGSAPVSWTKVADIGRGTQRHSAGYWYDSTGSLAYLVYAGGMTTGAAYLDKVYKMRTDTYEEAITGTLFSARGWMGSWMSGNYIYTAGGWNGSTTYNSIYRHNLTSGTRALLSAFRDSANLRQMVAMMNPDDTNEVYFGWGGSGAGLSNKLYTFNIAEGTSYDFPYTTESALSEEGDPADSFKPLRNNAVLGIADNILTLVGGTDESGIARSESYVLPVEDAVIAQTQASTDSYGYLRVSQHTSLGIFDNTVEGDEFVVTAKVRRASNAAVDGISDPLIRLVFKTGTDPYNSIRKVQTPRTVISDQWSIISLPLRVEAGETAVLAPYMRVYSGTVDIAAFQVFKGNIGALNRVVAQGGEPALTVRRSWSPVTAAGGSAVLRFSPFFGSQSTFNAKLFEFAVSPGSQITAMSLWYESTPVAEDPKISTAYATWYDYKVTGKFVLKWTDDSGSHTQDILVQAPVNHAQGRYDGYRSDTVSVRFTGTGSGLKVDLWHYGVMDSYTISKTVNLTGAVSQSVGMFVI